MAPSAAQRPNQVSSATDFVNAMGWSDDIILKERLDKGIERSLFPDLNSDEQTIVNSLTKINDKQINQLVAETNMSINQITATMFELEMKGIVKLLAGGMYHLLR